jgi:1,4-alpha-glucan branching enzyme
MLKTIVFLTYLEFAEELVNYVKETGFTHVEFMPIWNIHMILLGASISGVFCTYFPLWETTRLHGLVDKLHQAGIGVILDWVPSHFPDAHGLGFDGSNLEHPDVVKGIPSRLEKSCF